MKLRCTACGKDFELFGKEFDPCPECIEGVLVGGKYAKNDQSTLYQEMNQVDPESEIEYDSELDCNHDCENCLEDDGEFTNRSDFKESLSTEDVAIQESLSSADIMDQEFMLATLNRRADEDAAEAVLDASDIFIETFRPRDEEGNIINE